MGKNVFIVYILKNQKRLCYSNFKIKFKQYRQLRLIDMVNLPENINVVIDEGYAWLESRRSAKYINLFMGYVVFQLRKTNRDIFVTAQEISSIDIRYRKQWDYFVQCERIYDSSKPRYEWDFKYTIHDKVKKNSSIWVLPYFVAKAVFGLFDTNEIVPVSAKSRIEFELLKTQPHELMTKALDIAKKVKKKIKFISQDSVKFTLMVLGFDSAWYMPVYLILKQYIGV